MTSNVSGYLNDVCLIASDERKVQDLQILCLTQIKNFVSKKQHESETEAFGGWSKVNREVRGMIKTNMGKILVSGDVVATQAALVVSAIAVLELPRNEFHEVITVLCQNSSPTNNPSVRIVCLFTLGCILSCVDVTLLDMSECDSVFSVISGCLKASEQADVRVSAMDCLCSGLRFLETVFLDCSQCNGLMGLVSECWCVMDNLKLRNSSSETLGDVVHNFYFSLKRFGEGICKVTICVIGNHADVVKKNPSQEEILMNGTVCVIDVWEEIL